MTAGEAISLGSPEGLLAVEPDSTGAFELDLTSGNAYTVQYTQGADQYPTDGLPDLYTIDRVEPGSDTDLGEITVPTAYEVSVRVETASREDVTADAHKSVSHTNGGVTSGFELTHDPVELTGEVTVEADYDGETVTESRTVTEAMSVTLTV